MQQVWTVTVRRDAIVISPLQAKSPGPEGVFREMLRWRTLGALELRRSTTEENLAVLAQPKRVALLAYLVMAKPRGFHRRDTLLALFWPELDTDHARAALRQALTFLRRELGEEVIQTRSATDLAVDPKRLWCDATAFEEALEGQHLEQAIALYQGDFLPGFHVAAAPEFEHWLEDRRCELRLRAGQAASQLSVRAEAHESIGEALHWAQRQAALQPDDERACARVLALLDRAGNRAVALKTYETFAARLAAEYDIEPSPETRAIITGIRARANAKSNPIVTPILASAPTVDASLLDASADSSHIVAPPTVAQAWWRGRRAALGLAVTLFIGVIFLLRLPHRAPRFAEPAPQRTTIAVLPFEDLSADSAVAYFARGLQDEILTQLSKVGAIQVISRTSVMRYAPPNFPSVRRIAADLGAGSLVEGTVQVSKRRVRVNVQLIDAATDRQLWAERYDRTLDDAFTIQTDVARRIVETVGSILTDAEQQALVRAPTRNAEAYTLYLQGRDYATRPNGLGDHLKIAAQLLEKAVALDSGFALAHATLSMVHGDMYNLRYDPSPARAMLQRNEARIALHLSPDLPEAHMAMGLVHTEGSARDYEAGLADYRTALAGMPNSASSLASLGELLARMGRWPEAISAYTRAEQLNPQDPTLFYLGGTLTYLRLHRYPEAVRALDRALTLGPDFHSAAFRRAHAFILWRGELDTMRAVIARVPEHIEIFAYGRSEVWHLRLLLWERQPDSVLRVIHEVPVRSFDSYYWFYPTALYAGWAHQLRGDQASAHAAFDTARVTVDSLLQKFPDDWRLHAAHGLASAGLGRRADALREARWLQKSFAYQHDAIDWAMLAEERARILAQAGDPAAALDEVEQLLKRPSLLSIHALRLDPLWDPLRTNPRFQDLLVRYGQQN